MSARACRRRLLPFAVLAGAMVLSGCTSAGRLPGGMPGTRQGGALAAPGCATPSTVTDSVVRVRLADMGMMRMMGGSAPSAGPMRLRATPGVVAAGQVSLVVANVGWRTHELVVLPLPDGAIEGGRTPGPDGRIDESGSLGEASNSCRADSGEGITTGSIGWTTINLGPGRYELVCNLEDHYANGMHQELDVR